MTLKYEITDIKHPFKDLVRIRASRDIPKFGVKAGDLGGYISHAWNLSQLGECWVGDDALVYDDAWVNCDAWVSGDAQVYGNSQINGYSKICGCAHIYGNAQTNDYSQVTEHARVHGHAWISKNVIINGGMEISGDKYLCISSSTQIYYADGVTGYFDFTEPPNLIINGCDESDKEHYKTLAILTLS